MERDGGCHLMLFGKDEWKEEAEETERKTLLAFVRVRTVQRKRYASCLQVLRHLFVRQASSPRELHVAHAHAICGTPFSPLP